MTLSDILEDITDNKENVPIEESSKEPIVDKSTFKEYKLSQEEIDAVTNMYNIHTLRETINSNTKVDKQICVEVFTMLGDDVSVGKLTTNPSIINKQVVSSALDKLNDSIQPETVSKAIDLYDIVHTTIEKTKTIEEFLTSYVALAKVELVDRLRVTRAKAILEDNTTVDLLTCDLEDLIGQSLRISGYDKYIDLGNMVYLVIKADDFEIISKKEGCHVSTINDIYNKIIDILNTIHLKRDTLKQYIEAVDEYRVTPDLNKALPIVNMYNNVNDIIVRIDDLNKLTESDSVLYKYLNLLKFLD